MNKTSVALKGELIDLTLYSATHYTLLFVLTKLAGVIFTSKQSLLNNFHHLHINYVHLISHANIEGTEVNLCIPNYTLIYKDLIYQAHKHKLTSE